MTITFFSPYVTISPEHGLMYLLARRLRADGFPVSQLRCNGLFSVCDLDAERGWRRTVASCAECIGDQREVARWAGAQTFELSPYLSPADMAATAQWAKDFSTNQVAAVSIDGAPLWHFIGPSFERRFGAETLDARHKQHEIFLRRLAVSAIRAMIVHRRFLEEVKPELVFMTASDDFLARTLGHVSHSMKQRSVTCAAVPSRRCTILTEVESGKTHEVPLLIDQLSDLRNDPSSWPRELVDILDRAVLFLGLQPEYAAVSGG